MTMAAVPVETQSESASLRILCSNVIKEAIERLRPSFERSSGLQLSVVYGASAELRRNAHADPSFDLALLTTGVIDELASTGGVVPGSVRAIAQANLAVAARADAAPADVSTRDGMRRRLLASRSITYSRDGGGVPAIERMLAELGIAADLQSRIVKQTEAGRAAEAVALGETRAGLRASDRDRRSGHRSHGDVAAEEVTQVHCLLATAAP